MSTATRVRRALMSRSCITSRPRQPAGGNSPCRSVGLTAPTRSRQRKPEERPHVSFQMSGNPGPPRPPAPTAGRRRGRALLPTVIVAGVLLLVFSIFTGIYTDFLWFQSVGYTEVFQRELTAKA